MDDEDCYIFCGTSLPDPEEGQSAQKRANRELQVRDEKGRQRFHGAFTGGFSAGYFNTVGTKEGWEPSTFVSSRSKTAEHVVHQNPEDFMDAEDFSEFGIAPKKIHTTAWFRDGSSTSGKRKVPDYSDSVIPGEPPLKELIQPVADNIGIQILIKMGWKPGQGIGPRVRKGNRRKIGGTDGSSASLDSNPEADDPLLAAFTFAPKDTAPLPYIPKDDYHGIGYTGLSTKSVLSAPSTSVSSDVTKSWLEKSKKKLLISGKAFGIGALEDDDDIDIYSHEDMSQYDFSEFAISQETQKEAERATCGSHSSIGILDGFVESKKASTVRKVFPLPQLPAGYTPVRRFMHAPRASEPTTYKNQVLTVEDRSLILGERKFVTIGPSGTDPPKTVVPVDPSHSKHTTSAKTVSSEFQPFVNNPEKQKRYEEYLKLTQKEHIKTLQPSFMTEWEKQQELEEFVRAASLYQPLSKILSSRFVSRAHLEGESQGGIVKVEKSSTEKVVPSGPSHEKVEWHPSPLLCKRFNISNPYPNSSGAGVPNSGRKQKSLFDGLTFGDDNQQTSVPGIQKTPQVEEAVVSVKVEPDKSEKKSEDKVLKAQEYPVLVASQEIAPGVSKPPMDLFKAIFENTSDEEEESSQSDHSHDEEENSSRSKPSVAKAPNKHNMPAPSPPVHNAAPKKAFGVFANLDLDMLNNSRSAASSMTASSSVGADPPTCIAIDASSNSKIVDGKEQQEEKSANPSEGFYGPQLPPPGFTPLPVEPKTRSHKHSRRKEKHKHHKHKKKSKKQKKKLSSKESSSISSSSSDCDDIDPLTIIKKLNDLHSKTGKKYRKH